MMDRSFDPFEMLLQLQHEVEQQQYSINHHAHVLGNAVEHIAALARVVEALEQRITKLEEEEQ